MAAEEARERRRQLGGRLDAVREEAREALVLRLDERLGAGTDALATRVHLGERVEARALLRALDLRFLERMLAERDGTTKVGEALLELGALLGRGDLAGTKIVDRERELLGASAQLEDVALALLALGRLLLLADDHVLLATVEALELRLRAGDLRVRAAHGLAQLDERLLGDLALRREVGEA